MAPDEISSRARHRSRVVIAVMKTFGRGESSHSLRASHLVEDEEQLAVVLGKIPNGERLGGRLSSKPNGSSWSNR